MILEDGSFQHEIDFLKNIVELETPDPPKPIEEASTPQPNASMDITNDDDNEKVVDEPGKRKPAASHTTSTPLRVSLRKRNTPS